MKPLKNWNDFYLRKTIEEERHIKYTKQLNKLLENLQKKCVHEKANWPSLEDGKRFFYCKKCQKILE